MRRADCQISRTRRRIRAAWAQAPARTRSNLPRSEPGRRLGLLPQALELAKQALDPPPMTGDVARGPAVVGSVVADLGHEGAELVPLDGPRAGREFGLETGDESVVQSGVHAFVHEPAGDHVVILFAEAFEESDVEVFAHRLAEAAMGGFVEEIGFEPSQLLPEGGGLAPVRRLPHASVGPDDGARREGLPVPDAKRQVGRFVDLHEQPAVRVEAVGHEERPGHDVIRLPREVPTGPLPGGAVAGLGPLLARETVAHGEEPRAEHGLDDLPDGVVRGDVLEEGPFEGRPSENSDCGEADQDRRRIDSSRAAGGFRGPWSGLSGLCERPRAGFRAGRE